MRGLMSKDNKYEMSMEELTAFIDVTEKSGYKFHYMLTGGEPLLWGNLKEGVRLLRGSSSCNFLYMFTNLIDCESLDDEVMECMDCIKVSEYATNQDNLRKVKERYGAKVRSYDRTKFWVNPKQKISINTPVRCTNEGEIMLYDWHIYACLHSASLTAVHGDTETPICKPLELNYLDGLDEIRVNQAENICSLCTSNREIREMLSKPRNESQVRILI
jgi:hypothetical protein